MIDFHCHILYGIDDGSKSLEMSLEMIRQEAEQGVTDIVLTPHFYANHVKADAFLEKREKRYQALKEEVKQLYGDKIKLHLGAEVYYFGGIGKADIVPKLTIDGSDYLLLEMPFCQWTKDMLNDIKLLLEKQKKKLIFAHIERYIEFQKDKSIFEQVINLPVILQMNAGAFLKLMKRGKCIKLMKEDYDFLLGSDAHNLETRVPNLKDGRAVIEKKLGQQRLLLIDELGERILKNE